MRFSKDEVGTRIDSQRMRTAMLVTVLAWACVLFTLASLSPEVAVLPPIQYRPAFEVTLSLAPLEMDPLLSMPLPVPAVVPVQEEATPRSYEALPVEVAVGPAQTIPESPAEIEPGLIQPSLHDPAPADLPETSGEAEMPSAMEMAVAAELPALPDSPAPAVTPLVATPAATPVAFSTPAAISSPNAYVPRIPDIAPSADTLQRLDMAIAEKLKYPVQARKRGIQGTVVLYIAVEGSGRLTSWALEKSSGSKLLDEAGIKLLIGLFPFPGGFASAFQTRIAIAYTLD